MYANRGRKSRIFVNFHAVRCAAGDCVAVLARQGRKADQCRDEKEKFARFSVTAGS